MKEAPKSKNKKSGKGFKFNPYWIYGILFIVFLALNFLPRSAGKSTHWNEVRNMIVQGDVKELKLINDRSDVSWEWSWYFVYSSGLYSLANNTVTMIHAKKNAAPK